MAAVEFVQDLRHHLVFHASRRGRCERTAVRGAGDLRRAAHGGELRAALEQAHLVQRVVERHEFVRRVHALLGLRAQAVHPADDPFVEFRVRAHGVVDARAALEQARQDLVDVADREGVVRAVVPDRPFRARAGAVPGLARRVAVAHEQDVFTRRPAGNQHRHGLGLGEAGQVVEITVRAVEVLDVVVAHAHGRGRQDRDRVLAHDPHQLAPAAREFVLLHPLLSGRKRPGARRRAVPRVRPRRAGRPRARTRTARRSPPRRLPPRRRA